jgi:hypothetical protein
VPARRTLFIADSSGNNACCSFSSAGPQFGH